MSVSDSQVPAVLNISSGGMHTPVRIKFSSPSSLPTVFTELKYRVPNQFVPYLKGFFRNNQAEDAVFNYIHPVNTMFPVIFKTVRIIRTIEPGVVKPKYTIHLEPRKHDPFLPSSETAVDVEDFVESTFEIEIRYNERLSKFSDRIYDTVATVIPVYNDIETEALLIPEDSVNPFSDNQKQMVYEAMGIAMLQNDLQPRPVVCMGLNVGTRGTGETEKLVVAFTQIMPYNQLSHYGGQITDLKTALMATYHRQYGWQQDLVESRMKNFVSKKRVSSFLAQQLLRDINKILFGAQPLLLQRYFYRLPQFNTAKENLLPLKYKQDSGGNLLRNNSMDSKRFVPMNIGLFMQGGNPIRKNASRTYIENPNMNPFSCMVQCAQRDNCDIYSSVGRHCNLYDLSEEEAAVIGGNMDRIMRSPPSFRPPRIIPSDREYMKQNRFSFASWYNATTGKYDTKAYWAYTDMSRISKEDLDILFSYYHKDIQVAKFIKDGLDSMKRDLELTTETFVNSSGEYTLDSAIQSYSIAVQQAEQNTRDLALASTMSSVGRSTKIYYNLFTTALWIINIACLVGILYIIIMGFMGDVAPAPSGSADVAPAPSGSADVAPEPLYRPPQEG